AARDRPGRSPAERGGCTFHRPDGGVCGTCPGLPGGTFGSVLCAAKGTSLLPKGPFCTACIAGHVAVRGHVCDPAFHRGDRGTPAETEHGCDLRPARPERVCGASRPLPDGNWAVHAPLRVTGR